MTADKIHEDLLEIFQGEELTTSFVDLILEGLLEDDGRDFHLQGSEDKDQLRKNEFLIFGVSLKDFGEHFLLFLGEVVVFTSLVDLVVKPEEREDEDGKSDGGSTNETDWEPRKSGSFEGARVFLLENTVGRKSGLQQQSEFRGTRTDGSRTDRAELSCCVAADAF